MLTAYVSVMVLFTTFEDRKVVTGLYGGAHEIVRGQES